MAPKIYKIVLVGGSTMGSVSPLLAIAGAYFAEYLFIGTATGPEKEVVQKAGLNFVAISSGKFRRYFSGHNFLDFFKTLSALGQSLTILKEFKPDIVLTAGSFVAVPVAWAAWLLKIPVLVHQQDLELGLANRLMARVARKITVVFPEQQKFFDKRKVVLTGNPVRISKGSVSERPRIVITGGGQGARGLNNFVSQFISDLVKRYEVHHILGQKNWDQRLDLPNYFPYQFVTQDMASLLASADIIISRAGLSLISEAAALKKALILVPMTDTHQEKNAAWFAQHNAAYVVRQGSKHIMNRYLSKLTDSARLRLELGENLYNLFPKNPVKKYIDLIESIVNKTP